MTEITHTIGFDVPAAELYTALTTQAGIQNWWTNDCVLPVGIPQTARFGWKDYGWSVAVKIVELKPTTLVRWKCTESNMQNTAAWVGSEIKFAISEKASNQCELHFTHAPYPESSCYQVCYDGWLFFLGKSLKNYLETGQGSPYCG